MLSQIYLSPKNPKQNTSLLLAFPGLPVPTFPTDYSHAERPPTNPSTLKPFARTSVNAEWKRKPQSWRRLPVSPEQLKSHHPQHAGNSRRPAARLPSTARSGCSWFCWPAWAQPGSLAHNFP